MAIAGGRCNRPQEENRETRIGLDHLRHFAISLLVTQVVRRVRTTGSRPLRPQLMRNGLADKNRPAFRDRADRPSGGTGPHRGRECRRPGIDVAEV